MQFVVGLGNPGSEYEQTRHNLGFMAIEALARKFEMDFEYQSKFTGEVAKKGDLILIKPATYMNLSGTCVQKVMAFYDKSTVASKNYHKLFVLYDDLDIPMGKIKLVWGSSPKVHNGVNSVIQHLGSRDFWHGRLGSDNRALVDAAGGKDYVLKPLTGAERELVDEEIDLMLNKLYAALSS